MKIPRIFYACFHAFPTSKGASTHISQSISALSELAERVDVFCFTGAKAHPEVAENVSVH